MDMWISDFFKRFWWVGEYLYFPMDGCPSDDEFSVAWESSKCHFDISHPPWCLLYIFVFFLERRQEHGDSAQ